MGATPTKHRKHTSEVDNIDDHFSSKVKELHLAPSIPKNCIFFILILRAFTDKHFGPGNYPLDIINSIVLINALIGEFTGLCSRCYQWHNAEYEGNKYHSGIWKGLTYGDYINRGFVIDLFYAGQFGTYLRNTGAHAKHHFVHDTKKAFKLSCKAGTELIINSSIILDKGFEMGFITGLLALPINMVAMPALVFLGMGVAVGGAIASPVVGSATAIASPFIDGAQVIASDVNHDYHTHGLLDTWSCCRTEGSWAPPCTTCYKLISSSDVRTGKVL